jgi:hypothetical protein
MHRASVHTAKRAPTAKRGKGFFADEINSGMAGLFRVANKIVAIAGCRSIWSSSIETSRLRFAAAG